jgi:TolA-binding protein
MAVLFLCCASLPAGPEAARAQSPAGSSGAADAFAGALALYQDRLYGSAQEAFADFRSTFPAHSRAPEALFYEARALLAMDKGAAAARRLERLQAGYPAHPLAERAQLRLGRYFFEQGADEDARRTLRRVLSGRGPPERAPEARFLLGRLAQRQGRPAEALEQFRAVSETYPDAEAAPRALYQVASVHLQQGRTAEAADALERLARRYPEDPKAGSLGLALAEVYFDLERYGEVLGELDQRRAALETQSDRARAAFLRAEALRRQGGRRSEAANAYQRYLERFAGSADTRAARYGLALLRYRREEHSRAAALFARVAEEAPDSAGVENGDASADMRERAAYLGAVSRAEAGEAGAAAEAFAAFVRRFPQSPRRADAQYRRGRALLAAGRPAEAARVLGRLRPGEAPEDFEAAAEARYVRSRALREDGQNAEAIAALEDALAAGLPAEMAAQARFERGQLLLGAGRPAEAADAFAAYRRQAPEGERAAEARYYEAEGRYRAGAFQTAARGYQRYLDEHPNGDYAGAAQYGLGWASFQQADYAAAARAFERFLSRPDARARSTYLSDALLRLGDSYYARRRFAEAERAYARAEGDARDYALYQTGQVRSRTDDLGGAVAAWRELVEKFPESELREEARFQIGQARFQQERYDDAVRAWRALLEGGAGGALAAKAQYSIGDALYNAGRQNAAARAYRAVLENYSGSAFASDAARGVALVTEGDASFGADSLNALSPDAAAEVRFRRAEAQYQRGQTDAARQAFLRFVRTSSREDLLPQAYYYLGTIYAESGKYREAEGYLRQVLREYPDSDRRADAAGRLGALYLQTRGDPERALDAYEQMQAFAASDADRVQARARYGQGRALAALGRSADAEARFREATERAPESPIAQNARVARARLYEDTGRSEEAQALYRRVAEESRGAAGAEALYRLGALLLEQDRPEAAVEELRRLPELFAGFPDWIARGLLAQARAFRAMDRPAQARRLYDRLQNKFAGTEEARTARKEQEAL